MIPGFRDPVYEHMARLTKELQRKRLEEEKRIREIVREVVREEIRTNITEKLKGGGQNA